MGLLGQIQFSALPEDLRLDAEYHVGLGSAERESFRKRGKLFGHYFERILHPGEFTRKYQPSGHLFLRAQNVRAGYVEIREPSYVSAEVYEALPEAVASAGDLLIVRTGANVGDVAIVPGRYAGALVSSHTLRLVPRPNAPVHALAALFASDLGQRVLTSIKTGGAQGQINGSSLKSLYLPVLDKLQGRCKSLLEESDRLTKLGEDSYPDAEAELLDRIGWNDLRQQPSELSYVCDFADLARASRSDAEFFQPQCNRLARRLVKRGAKTIGTFCPKPTRGVQPEIVDGGDVIVVDSKAVRPQGVEPAAGERTSREFRALAANAKGRVERGDVLLNSTGRGTLGRAACYQLKTPALCDNHVAILRPDPKVCDPVYLALFLNSPAGLAQSEQFQTGSSGQLEIYPEHIQQFLIYLPRQKNGTVDIAWQKRLAAKVQTATAAKAAARAKLEEAKRLVEDALTKRR